MYKRQIHNNPAKAFLVVGDGYLDLSKTDISKTNITKTDLTCIRIFQSVGCNLVTGNEHNNTSLLCSKGLCIRDTGIPELERARFLLVTLFFIAYLREGSRGGSYRVRRGATAS